MNNNSEFLRNDDQLSYISQATQAHTLFNIEGVFGVMTDPLDQLATHREPRERQMSVKGRAYQLEIADKNKNTSYLKLKKQINKINDYFREPKSTDLNLLNSERERLDGLKDEMNQAYRAFDCLVETEEARNSSYRWFDIRDREYTECRIRMSELIQSLEKELYKTKSITSESSRRSQTSKSSGASVRFKRVEAAAKSARLKAEMQFLDQEVELRRLQIKRELAIASAEEDAINKILIEENEGVKNEPEFHETKPAIDNFPYMKAESTSHHISPAVPKIEKPEPEVQGIDINSATLRELVKLQTKQTELSAMIVNQQKISSLPVQEPPTFNGNPFDYPAFRTAFDTIISRNVASDRDKLYFLNKYTSGKANDVVKGFLALSTDTSYQEARKLLDHRFGNAVHVAEAYKSRLYKWPAIKDGDSSSLQELADFLLRCEEAMKAVKSMKELDSTQTLLQISSKLPSYSGVKWCRLAHEVHRKTESFVTFHDFAKFVREESDLANDPIFSPDNLRRERRKTDLYKDKARERFVRPTSSSSFAISTSKATPSRDRQPSYQRISKPIVPCPLCKDRHSLDKCAQFNKKDLTERSQYVFSQSLCFGCLNGGHISKNCEVRLTCEECGRRHPTSLHGARPSSNAVVNLTSSQPVTPSQVSDTSGPESKPFIQAASMNASVSHSSVGSHNDVTNSMIVPVLLRHKDNPENEVKVYALLDEASDTTFIKAKVQQELQIPGVDTKLHLSTMLGRQEISVSRIDGLVVERIDRRVQVDLPRVYSREEIPSRRNQIPTPEVADKWPHLRRIKDKILPYQDHLEIGLLIGCNCPKAIKPKEVILGKGDDPYAIRTLLGWGIIGPIGTTDLEENEGKHVSTCNRIVTCEIVTPETSHGRSFVLDGHTKEIINPYAIAQMFEQDFSERKDLADQGLSRQDRRFLAIADQGIRQNEDGHYELPLPIKDPDVKLPNNRESVLRRLNQLKRRLDSNLKYREDYVAFMSKIIKNGCAEKVLEDKCPNKESRNRNIWYIPHHGVYHPKKPNKIRVVFDCAAEYKNESLNKHLLQGPDLTNNLVGVLCRFRKEPVGVMCDIESMFYQVRVAEEYRDLLRFLWWEDGDTSRDPVEYRMTVHLFGASSSPGCANYALKRTADDYEKELGSATAEFVRRDFYVDDGLKSCASVKEASEIVKSVKEMCQKGGFNLHKFVSNSKEVIKTIPDSDRAEGIKSIDLDLDTLPMERALGVQWCIESDTFQFKIVLQNKPCTRRGILSTVSSIFDPLGFIAPLMLEGKAVLQELCRDKVGWDDPVPENLKSRWEKWRTDLHLLENISIPRCYKPAGFGRVVKTELHHFSDASIKGYGQCSYVRQIDEQGQIHCAFVMGKSRVTPLKPVTIPRLELQAAVCSVRISKQLRQELEYENVSEIFWTDSKVVLGYIANDSRRFHVFVANRVHQIQETTEVEQWRYVETKHNPADDASRGLKPRDLLKSRWFSGPEFLWNEEDEWPSTMKKQDTKRNDEAIAQDPEVKKTVSMATVTSTAEKSLADRLEYFSSWHRAKKAVALCIRYTRNLHGRMKKVQETKVQETEKGQRAHITVEEMQRAENVIVKSLQTDNFKDEIDALKKIESTASDDRSLASKKKTHLRCTSSAFYKLDPFVDEEGILRVGGRIRRANLSDCVKFPVILPKKCHITKLVVKHFHDVTRHQGRTSTLNEVRSNGYWIVGSTSVVSSYIADCVTCHKLRGTTQSQKMSDLPEDRLEPAPPFTYCAVDYFGPWIIKEKRKELKRYGALFTCMASRAVHLEVSHTLNTDSFLNALRRFICRRGPIRQLRSDQGTNFVGARRELKEALDEFDHDKIRRELLRYNCDWFTFKMNVPSASHMGGVWERQIRSVRSVLAAILNDSGTQLDDESLTTFMCEAEAIVNSRPLTTNELQDPDALSALTPNHLLTMKSKIVLPPPGNFQDADKYSRKRWRRVQHLSNEFWCRWRKEFLQSLQLRQKWTHPRRNLEVDDIVLIKDESIARNHWQLARITRCYPDQDGHVRKVQLLLSDDALNNKGLRVRQARYLDRPIHKLVLLVAAKK